jgi:hypothetical protein
MKLDYVTIGDQLLWRHRRAKELQDQATHPEQLQRIIRVTAVYEDYIKTTFGDYLRCNGLNTDAACGCKRFCDCFGQVEIIDTAISNRGNKIQNAGDQALLDLSGKA